MQFESERAIFKFEESDSDLIQLLADYLDSHVDNIYKFFEVNMPKEKLVVNIIPTKEEFDVLSRQAWGQSEKWMIFKSNRRSREFLKNELFDKAKKFYQNAKHENNQLI